jgi:hypothetical protein
MKEKYALGSEKARKNKKQHEEYNKYNLLSLLNLFIWYMVCQRQKKEQICSSYE